MTMNKSQGQSLHRGGIFCSIDFFTHRQFYVAASRVGRSSRLRIVAQDEQTKNVYNNGHMRTCTGTALVRQTPEYIKQQPYHLPEETGVKLMCAATSYVAETWTLTKQAQEKLAVAHTKMERNMLNITYKDRKTNRERTNVIDIISNVSK